jgi:hypothetical protein
MSSCLRGAVIDIVLFLSDLAETGRLEPGCRPAEAIKEPAQQRDAGGPIVEEKENYQTIRDTPEWATK